MHPISAFTLALLAGLFWQEATPSPSQEGVPAGSYQQTCTDISVKNGNLYAKCQDAKGKAHSARLSHYEKCDGEIINKKGSLECSHAPAALPPGPYAESCKDPQMKGTTLHAVCRSADGREMPASLKDANRCAQGVANLNGVLTCVVNEVIPPGSYMATCKDIRVQGTTLYASCNDGQDHWRAAQLRDAHKCPGDISNYHGELRCVEIRKMERR
jgi:CVNH domain-containing protein